MTKISFEELKTGRIFWYRKRRYMKCSDTTNEWDRDPNAFTHPVRNAAPKYVFFKNTTMVTEVLERTYHRKGSK